MMGRGWKLVMIEKKIWWGNKGRRSRNMMREEVKERDGGGEGEGKRDWAVEERRLKRKRIRG